MLDAVRQSLLAEDAEETFDQVHPRGMRGRVVKVDLRLANQPSPSRLVFVDVEVVHDHMEFPVRVGSHDLIHKAEKVYRGAPVADMSDHFAGGNLQGGDHGLGSMADGTHWSSSAVWRHVAVTAAACDRAPESQAFRLYTAPTHSPVGSNTTPRCPIISARTPGRD